MNQCIPVKVIGPDQEAHWSCPTCKDEGVPARVVSIDENHLAIAQMNDGEREVLLDLLDDVQVGDFVLVHLDTAIAKLNPEDVIVEQNSNLQSAI